MKSIAVYWAVLTLFLHASDTNASLFDQITQPKLSFQSDYLYDAGFEGFDANVRTYKQKIQINNEILGISYDRWDFDWREEETLPFYRGKTPIDTMERVKLYANIPVFINEKWFMLNSVNVNAAFEKEYSNALGAGVLSFLSYKVDDAHAIQIGAFANYHPIKTLALPALGYTYRIRETDGLSVLLGFPRAYVGYHINPKLLVKAGMIYSQAVIRLADQSGIEQKGYVEAKDFQSNIGLRYILSQKWQINADLLYAFKRDFTIYTHEAYEVDSYSIEPNPGAMLKVQYVF